MNTSAKVILDSISPNGDRLTTMEVTCHRFVLAEFNTHRKFSRNSASSRAIPVEKQLQRVVESPAYPLEWPSEQPGMQGGSELADWELEAAKDLFNDVCGYTLGVVNDYLLCNPEKSNRLHKSLINRLLEPFMWHTIIVSSTEWNNFFGLRCNPMAQPEIRAVAELMEEAYNFSQPEILGFGWWHMPYVQEEEIIEFGIETMKKVSAARCARVSYLTHDGVRDIEKDIELYERLTTAVPAHASPLEHVARPAEDWENVEVTVPGNFSPGWVQLRHEIGG